MLLCEIQKCTGCGLCKEVCPKQAISFEYDWLGFRYPKIDMERCVECGLCSKKCPELNPFEKESKNDCYLAWANDDAIHFESASGGISYLLAQYVIERGGFSVGCVWDHEFNAVLEVIDNLDDLKKTIGSKYVQSYIASEAWDDVQRRLRQGQQGIFFGLPCQVSAMKKYLKTTDNIIFCDILCHGGCSPLIHHKHLEYVKGKRHLKSEEVKDVRYRGGRYDFFYSLWNDNGKVLFVNDSESDSYFYSFRRHYLFRKVCYSCSYAGSGRISDITVGDFWGINQNFIKDKHTLNGMNLVLVHSDSGAGLLEEVKDKVELYQRRFDEAIIGNEDNLVCRKGEPLKRNSVLNNIKEIGFEKTLEQDADFQKANKIGKKRKRRVLLRYMLPEWAVRIAKKILNR